PISKNHFGAGVSRSCVGDRLAVSSGAENDGDFVARLERAAGPAGSCQDARAVGFDAPLDDLAGAVLHIEVNLRMWIRPDEFRDGPFDFQAKGLVVGAIAMVC